MTNGPTIPVAAALDLAALIVPTEHGIASRVLARTDGANVTLFALDAGQELSEHTSPFDALVFVLEGEITLTIEGQAVRATPGSVVRMPAKAPHAVLADQRSRMLLVMLREPQG